MKPHYTLIILVLLVISGCDFSSERKKTATEDFYSSISDWDIKYIPIFPPFRASSTYPDEWLISGSEEIHLGENEFGAIHVESFGVSKNYIYGMTKEKLWFLFNTNTSIYSEYATEKELNETLKMFNLDKNKIETCAYYFDQLNNNKRCYWFPKVGSTYPKYEDAKPDKVYTIVVNGKENISDFKVSQSIRKSPSKLYFFKFDYKYNQNELFYFSANGSSPKLISDTTLYSVYCEGDTYMNISIYTPFPVAQSKGIPEKDRIVISKLVEIK